MSFGFPVVDRQLAQKLERTEASANAAFVTARAAITPASGATWVEIAGAYAMFDGVESPITQTWLFDPVGPAEMDRLEAFFAERGAVVHHEVCPLADKSLRPLLVERGYSPVELSSVLYLPLPSATAAEAAEDADAGAHSATGPVDRREHTEPAGGRVKCWAERRCRPNGWVRS